MQAKILYEEQYWEMKEGFVSIVLFAHRFTIKGGYIGAHDIEELGCLWLVDRVCWNINVMTVNELF